MQRKTFTRSISLLTAVLLISAFSGTGAQAATKATAGGLCAKAATKTMISGKSFTCTKVLSGKLIWVATATAKPQITGAPGGDGGPGDDHGVNDAGRQAALKAYNSCLTAHGGTAIVPGKGFHPEGGDDGARPSTPPVQPKLSAAQQKAVAACVALAPKFGPGADH